MEYKSCSYPGGNVRLFFIDQQGNKKKIACKNIWGFKYGDALFRTEPRSSQPARVMSLGEIVYYENGLAHLEMIRDNSTTGRSDLGYYSYISPNLKAPMTPLPNFGFSSKARRMRELLKIHPEYKPLFECLEKDYDLKTVIYCVIEFEESTQ